MEGRGKDLVNYLQLAQISGIQFHELSLQNLNAIGQSLLQILKNDDIMTKYFFAISRIRNLVGLRGILSLINADGWNAAMDPRKLQTLPSALH